MLTSDELKALMPLLAIGARKLRRKLGDLEFAATFGGPLASALAKFQQMEDERNADKS